MSVQITGVHLKGLMEADLHGHVEHIPEPQLKPQPFPGNLGGSPMASAVTAHRDPATPFISSTINNLAPS